MLSSIRLANSGGVKTSSLERLAMQVSTSGLRPRSAEACLSRSCAQLPNRHRRVALRRREDLVLAQVREQGVFLSRRHSSGSRCRSGSRGAGTCPSEVSPLGEGDGGASLLSIVRASPWTMFWLSTYVRRLEQVVLSSETEEHDRRPQHVLAALVHVVRQQFDAVDAHEPEQRVVAPLEVALAVPASSPRSLRASTRTRKLPDPQAGSRKRESMRSDSSLTRSSMASTSQSGVKTSPWSATRCFDFTNGTGQTLLRCPRGRYEPHGRPSQRRAQI